MIKPYVLVYATISVDGGLGFTNRRIVLSSDRDLFRLHYIRSKADAIMIGANTVIIDDPLLTIRLPQYNGNQPYRVVVDQKLKTNPNYRVYDTSIAPSILVTSVENRGSYKLKKFVEKGVDVVLTNTRDDGLLDMSRALMEMSNRYGIRKVLVQGGGFLIASLIKQKLIDELIISVAPVMLGLSKVSLVNDFIDEPVHLKLIDVEVDYITNEVILHYKPIAKSSVGE